MNYSELTVKELEKELNAENREERLLALREIRKHIDKGRIEEPKTDNDVNNHIHTSYSFSPYSPTKAVYKAYMAGLITAGIMDHDSMAGAEEFIEAGKILDLPVTIGVECRVSMNNTQLNGKRINNPDQKSVAYCTIHGVSHSKIDEVQSFFRPLKDARNERNKKMIDRINKLLDKDDLKIDFNKDVVPISLLHDGGSITERHLLFAVAKKLVSKFGKGTSLLDFLKNDLNLEVNDKSNKYLSDSKNEHYEYDLLGLLKANMVSKIYVDATEECPDVKEFIDFAKSVGGISAYAYLGDITNSVTGDKKAQKFEDEYIEELFEVITNLGFNAVTYMPTRNTLEQLMKVKKLCQKHGLFEISGEDINQPRQEFVSKAMRKKEFSNLIDSTWALIGHEIETTKDIQKGMFSAKTIKENPDLNVRIEKYKKIAKKEYE